MKIEINWMDDWANAPVFEVSQAVYPGWPLSHERAWENRDGIHRADDVIFVHYFYSDDKPTDGFGGAQFSGTFHSGDTFCYKGVWSSCASVVNQYFPGREIVDVTLIEGEFSHRDTVMHARVLIDWWHTHETDWGLAWCIERSGERILQPTRNGQLKDTLVKYHRVEHLSKETDEQRASRFGFRRLANAEGESVWVHSTEDFNISNPYLSECGRFEVRPSYYGLSDEAARSVRAEPPGGLQ